MHGGALRFWLRADAHANQLPVTVDQRNNELRVDTKWVNAKGMVRAHHWGRYFRNDLHTLT